MANVTPKILLVDDEEKFLNSIAERLKLLGFDPYRASSGRQAQELAKNNRIDLAIVDLKMPDMDGLVTITKLKEIDPDLRSVLLTGYGSEKVKQATEALDAAYFEKDQMEAFWNFMKSSSKGGNIIVIKPPSARMPSVSGSGDYEEVFKTGKIEIMTDPQSIEDSLAPSPNDRKRDDPTAARRFRMIGETQTMQELRKNIERLAVLDCPVIIRGETGTGKELAARMIHSLSPRKKNRFMAINCGCFRNDLLIEDLFGPGNHVFSGESQPSGSIAGSESGGTILLDQIEDMSLKMQLSMLKIIDSKKVSLKDGIGDFPFDVRILAASRYSLGKLVEEGKFREELYYRLNVLELFIPPLRERRDDIPPLCGYFLDKFAEEFKKAVEYISEEVISIFMSYDFPGNVRELEHIIERAVILADGKTIESKHLPGRFQKADFPPLDASRKFMTLAEMEKNYILEVLDATGGNKSKTAELLGISRAALWRKLKQFKEEK
ncbi:MAG: sigma-54-dependent Fis family transcriptional regulator [Desulfobacterales bacterium]|nr:MAG: sigma-54-dependent Fis family transcriptional regulator [Desulfobacterales bacterium]